MRDIRTARWPVGIRVLIIVAIGAAPWLSQRLRADKSRIKARLTTPRVVHTPLTFGTRYGTTPLRHMAPLSIRPTGGR